MRRRAATAALAVLALAGCGDGAERRSGTTTAAPVESTPATTEAKVARTIALSVYFLRDGKIATAHRAVLETRQVGATALRELLAGPSDAEAEAGLTSDIPVDTEFLGLSIEDGVATVDLSREFGTGMERLAQVVYTLTQFSTVRRVRFAFDGKPVLQNVPIGRGNFEPVTPAIFVESPAVGDAVRSPLRIHGTANTFEATFIVNVADGDGRIIAERFVTATSGSGTRGTFDVSVPFEVDRPGRGALIVFESSAKDGSPIHVVEIPLRLEP